MNKTCSNYYELKRTDRKGKIQKQIFPFRFPSQGMIFSLMLKNLFCLIFLVIRKKKFLPICYSEDF